MDGWMDEMDAKEVLRFPFEMKMKCLERREVN